MHSRNLNEQMVRVLKAIGYDVGFCRGEGQYLYDREGTRYLDLLSGFGVFAIGRNHRALREALKSILDSELPNLVQMDVSTLAGILAERLLAHVPYLDKALFLNSGSEAVEAAIKFARAATGRPGSSIASTLSTVFPMERYPSMAMTYFATASSRCCPAAFASPSTTWSGSKGRFTHRRSLHSLSSRFRARASTCRPTII